MSNKYDKSKIGQAIDGMTSVCAKGRVEVRKLVESIIGEPLDLRPELHVGHIYESADEGTRLLIKEQHSDSYTLVRIHSRVSDTPLGTWTQTYGAPFHGEDMRQHLHAYGYKHVGPATIQPAA